MNINSKVNEVVVFIAHFTLYCWQSVRHETRVQGGDGSRKETVFTSVCLHFNASVVPSRGQQVKKLRTGM